MELGLAGKFAISTGGSGGIGRRLVREFARAGIHVLSATMDGAAGQRLAR